jgi:hypothetical protein
MLCAQARGAGVTPNELDFVANLEFGDRAMTVSHLPNAAHEL